MIITILIKVIKKIIVTIIIIKIKRVLITIKKNNNNTNKIKIIVIIIKINTIISFIKTIYGLCYGYKVHYNHTGY